MSYFELFLAGADISEEFRAALARKIRGLVEARRAAQEESVDFLAGKNALSDKKLRERID